MPKIPRPRKLVDECIAVSCSSCSNHLGYVIPNAEILCRNCSTDKKHVWGKAKSPEEPLKYASARRKARREKAS